QCRPEAGRLSRGEVRQGRPAVRRPHLPGPDPSSREVAHTVARTRFRSALGDRMCYLGGSWVGVQGGACAVLHSGQSCTVCTDGRPLTAMSEPAGRRELTTARTRQALVDAARELARERGLEHVTAEQIAEGAGVSRRTFFNYFPNIEAVVAAGLAEPLQRIAAALLGRPAAEEPLTAIAAALR